MSNCSCSHNITEDTNPALDDFKSALTHLGSAIKKAHKTEEGKKLSTEYWTGVVKMLKKAKLGVSMMELGIDDEDEIKNSHDATIDKVKPKPADEKEEDSKEKESDENSKNKQNEQLAEKSVSKSQQRLFGMVHAYNNGDLKSGDVDEDLMSQIKKISSGMTKKDAKKMAKTNHDDLPEKAPKNEHYDILNHFSILLNEEFESVDSDGVEFKVENDKRKFIIQFDGKFNLVSENYNFEIGDASDLMKVVTNLSKLMKCSEYQLKEDYINSIS